MSEYIVMKEAVPLPSGELGYVTAKIIIEKLNNRCECYSPSGAVVNFEDVFINGENLHEVCLRNLKLARDVHTWTLLA